MQIRVVEPAQKLLPEYHLLLAIFCLGLNKIKTRQRLAAPKASASMSYPNDPLDSSVREAPAGLAKRVNSDAGAFFPTARQGFTVRRDDNRQSKTAGVPPSIQYFLYCESIAAVVPLRFPSVSTYFSTNWSRIGSYRGEKIPWSWGKTGGLIVRVERIGIFFGVSPLRLSL